MDSSVGKELGDLDLVLAIDTTSSMGPVLDDVKRNLVQLMTTLRSGPGTVRVGVVAYRDIGSSYIVHSLPFADLRVGGDAQVVSFISGLSAAGGNDWPESMEKALDASLSMQWRTDVPSAIIVIADAPPHHQDQAMALSLVDTFASKIPGAQTSLIDVGSGADPFMRALPARGRGQYVTYDGNILKSLYPAITGCSGE